MARRLLVMIGLAILCVGPLSGVSSAQAPTASCYPPPCGVAVDGPAANLGKGADLHLSPPQVSSQLNRQGPTLFVVAGLLMMSTTLTTLCLVRRRAMNVTVRSVSSVPGAVRSRAGGPHRVPQRSLR